MTKDVSGALAGKKVFISHSAPGTPLAWELARGLEARRVSAWLDERDLLSGQDLSAALESAIEHADVFLFVVTPEETVSPRLRHEWRVALKYFWDDPERKRLVPVLVGGADAPSFLSDLQPVRAGYDPRQWNTVIESVVNLLESPTAVRDEAAYAEAQDQQRKHLDFAEKWARSLKAAEEEVKRAALDSEAR